MVSCGKATTTCVVQKEKTQTRITFNNLSVNLTVDDLYKYVQLHLEEDRPFELTLVRDDDAGCGGGDLVAAGPTPLKISLEDKKHRTLLAAGLNFENGAANTVVLISAPRNVPRKDPKIGSSMEVAAPAPQQLDRTEDMGVPCNGAELPVTTNGSSSLPAADVVEPVAVPELNGHSKSSTNGVEHENGEPAEDRAPLSNSPVENSAAETATKVPVPPPLPALEYPSTGSSRIALATSPLPTENSPKLVGLVNQAMTCYLNSLLQALYMTPEFRNALYNWEFDGQDESKSIPYQLQRLFLNLQTSPKSAVETTDLTRSFGWDSSEAWQQHDIQELCRVMFDALEHKFKNTTEADLINRLYEGKMIDYLKCLSCGIEKQREDTFLDIPLPVKPFGSTVAFESIEEALRAFIKPEILTGNNQYNCETCQKKCDAHKGLKFSKFPYILTLHLKRFDFDYQTFHRIKLNDKVTFPQTLNLNGFLNVSTDFENGAESIENGISKEEGSSEQANGTHNGRKSPMDEVDAEMDASTTPAGPGKATYGSHTGPYLYELFAILIHSGSANGGHYYVYIKDFGTNNWFCFNDQSVSPITQEDIVKSFGGGAGRYHYSGAYTTSTNAYMLMYRQMDPARNKDAIHVDEFPEHIKSLQKKLKDRQEMDYRRRTAPVSTEYSIITTRVYHYDRVRCTLSDVKIHISGDYYLDDLLQRAYDRMSLATLGSLNLCRLVAFDSKTEQVLANIENQDVTLLQDVLDKYPCCDFLLEERNRDETFKTYSGPMVNARVYVVDLKTGDIDGPRRVPINLQGTVMDMKEDIRTALKRSSADVRVALFKSNFTVIFENDKDVLKHEIDPSELCPVKLFVASFPEEAKSRTEQFDRKLKRAVERFNRTISLHFKVPAITPACRKLYSIPEFNTPEVLINPLAEVPVEQEKGVADKEPVDIQVAAPDVSMEVELRMNDKALSPTPEPTTSQSESTASPSPEPPEVVTKKPLKKKSLSTKSVDDKDGETKSKEKSPVTVRETVETKEVVVNGVTKKVRVVKRFVKKDPSKKVVAATAAETVNGGSAEPVEVPATEKSSTLTDKPSTLTDKPSTPTKVVKKVKVTKSPLKEIPSKPVVKDEAETKIVNQPVVENGTEIEVLPKVEPPKVCIEKPEPPKVCIEKPEPPVVDSFAFLDEELVENGCGSAGPYFRAIPKNKSLCEPNGDDEMLIQVHAEKNMTISTLKSFMEPVLKVSKDYFKINRFRTETLRLHESVSSLADGDELIIELGRILQDGEYKYKVSHLKLSAVTDYTEELPHLCDYIVSKGQRVDDVKRGILQYLGENGHGAIAEKPAEQFKIWTKLYQSLGQVCNDNWILDDDFSLRRGGEFVLQEMEGEAAVDPMADCDDFVIFTRKWNPDTLVLEPYEAVTLPSKSELMQVLSDKSGIAYENLEYARNMLPFPKMKISKTCINSDMDWKSEPFVTSVDSSRNGHVYFYRDKTVPHKELSTIETAAIHLEETSKRDAAKAALNGGSNGVDGGGGGGSGDGYSSAVANDATSSYTAAAAAKNRRKERALKIYLDASPVKAVVS